MPHPPFGILTCQPQSGFASPKSCIDLVQRLHQPIWLLDHIEQRCWHGTGRGQIEQENPSLAPAITIPPDPIEDPQNRISDAACVRGRALERG